MHRYWGTPGGGQLVCASAADALRSAGMKVALSGVFSFDPKQYVRWFGIDISGMRTYTMGVGPKAFGLLATAFEWIPAKRAIRDTNAELLFTDDPTYRPLLSSFPDLRVLEYVHFPLEASLNPRLRHLGFYYKDDPHITSRYGHFPMSAYWKVYMHLTEKYMRPNPFEYAAVVFTNSRWTASVIKKIYGKDPLVLNPPLPPSASIKGSPAPFSARKNAVVMLGRFSEEKRYDWVISDMGKQLKKMGIKLVIFGGAVTGTQKMYLERVKGEAKRAGLTISMGIAEPERALSEGSDIWIVSNAPRDLINYVMDRAKIFLHATVNEHWGIAVAEAMARGLPVVVHKSGGAWTDLAEEGKTGMGYEKSSEAINALSKLISDEVLWDSLSRASLKRTSEVSLDMFEQSFLNVVEKIM